MNINRISKSLFRPHQAILTAMLCIACCWPAYSASLQSPRGKAEHVVVIVWDGMRRDFVSPQYTPTLWNMIQDGVFFRNHHSMFITATEVNGTAIATGSYPGNSGVFANSIYRPELGFMGAIATESLDSIRRGDLLTKGNYLLVPTVAEILQEAGFSTITAGTKPVTVLHDRKTDRTTKAQTNSVTLFSGQTIPKSALQKAEKANDDKKFPTTNSTPNSEKDNWTAKAMTHGFWKNGVPKFSLLWLYDPDSTQHGEGVGMDQSLAGISNSDKILDDVLKMLDEKKIRDKTDVFVVSDHGFSNIKRGPDVVEAMKKAKFKAVRNFVDPEAGEIMVVGHGGSFSCYVVNHDEAVTRKLIQFLQGTDFAGVIFSRVAAEGTFPLAAANIGATNSAPDLVVSMRWLDIRDDLGTPGMVYSDGGTRGKGTHASLSKYDIGNTLVAAGPDFKKGFIDTTPTANIDLVPTVLWILGVAQPQSVDGRVIHEALATSTVVPPKTETNTQEAVRDFGIFTWRQYIKVSRVGANTYLDEGNGGMEYK